jgi:hypothetical protein
MTTHEKRRPGSKPWATGTQLEYLKSMQNAYVEAQRNHTGVEFWARVMDHWESTWGIQDVPANDNVDNGLPGDGAEEKNLSGRNLLLKVSDSHLGLTSGLNSPKSNFTAH